MICCLGTLCTGGISVSALEVQDERSDDEGRESEEGGRRKNVLGPSSEG